MASINRATLLGNVGKDPEIRSMNSGDRVANLSIATSETWKDKQTGEKKERTEWHRVVVWGPLVEIVEKYVFKGSKLYVEGQIQTRKWQDQSGADKYATEIVLRGFDAKIVLLDKREGGGDRDGGRSQGGGNETRGYGGGGGGYQEREDFSADLDDEIPFISLYSLK